MPYIPHTDAETAKMLKTIGIDSIDDLFAEIPSELRCQPLDKLPDALSEMEVHQLMQQRAAEDDGNICFAGAGAYDHYIPSAVWSITSRGEFYTAYTPYQAEASQGTLQVLYEFQSMVTELLAMDVANGSLYDGASALAESVLMAVRANRKSKSRKILIPRNIHPAYRKTVQSIVHNQKIELIELPFNPTTGQTDFNSLEKFANQDITAVVIPQPNYFGVIEAIDELTDWAHQHQALAIAVVNPIAMSVLKPAGQWGQQGADICCGEGQPLGLPLLSGGPYLGFMTCKQKWVRQMPGRIVGKTTDVDGKIGYTLTLQAREQHIRRAKATSNICTNQGLMVTAATIHMALMGATGFERVAAICHQNMQTLRDGLTAIKGIKPCFNGTNFHEIAIKLPCDCQELIETLAKDNWIAGVNISNDYPELGQTLLLCATEKRTETEIKQLIIAIEKFVTSR